MVNEDEQRDKQEYDDQYVANNRQGLMEVNDLMQALDGFDCELEDEEDQKHGIISTSISHDNEHTNNYSIHQPTPDPNTDAEWNGYKVVKDNFDKNICPSFQRVNRQTPLCLLIIATFMQ